MRATGCTQGRSRSTKKAHVRIADEASSAKSRRLLTGSFRRKYRRSLVTSAVRATVLLSSGTVTSLCPNAGSSKFQDNISLHMFTDQRLHQCWQYVVLQLVLALAVKLTR
jgi:hypothetical protein